MHIHKQRPDRPDAGAQPQLSPPQSLGDKSDASQAIPEDIGHIGAPKSTPGHPQPTRERHTTPLQPPKPLNSLQEPQSRSFQFSFASDTSSSSDHTPIKSRCDPDAFPTFSDVDRPPAKRRALESGQAVRNRSTAKGGSCMTRL